MMSQQQEFRGPEGRGEMHIVRSTARGFADEQRTPWTVREIDASHVPGARAARCLIFESPGLIRRLWSYPPDWRTLPDADLEALMNGPRGVR